MQFHMNSMSADEYRHLRDSARYQATTLVGNWNEERELRRSIMRDLLLKKSTGTLKLDAFGQRMAVALADTELTKVADDPYVHFGDVLQMVHLETGSVLAVDVGERDTRPGEEACATSGASECRAPCARNSLIIVKYDPPRNSPLEPDYGDDGVVRYGQKVRLAFHPMATGNEATARGGSRPLCLFSKPVSTTHCAKYCRNQLVGATFRSTFDTVWQVMTPDPAMRNASEGVEVLAGAPIVLMHCQTQKALLLENQRYPNDFGVEWELSARNDATHGLKSALEQSQNGIMKGTLPKSGQAQNLWVFMTGSKIASLPDSIGNESTGDLSALVSSLPGEGVSMLERKVVTHSNQKSELSLEDMVLLVRQCSSTLDNYEIAQLVTPFLLSNKPGILNAHDFIAALRAAAGSR